MSLPILSALLVRPAPRGEGFERESLTSWLHRLATANGFGSYGELFSYERLKIPSNAALDVAPHRWQLMPALQQLSQLRPGVAEGHGLTDELQALSGDPTGSLRRWILTADRRRGIEGTTCHAICPECLREDAVPYWRRSWRLSMTTTCSKHRSLLVDVCPVCGASMSISGSRTVDIRHCENCSRKLLSIPAQSRALQPLPAWRTTLPSISGPQDFPVSLSCSHLWWDGIRCMLSVFMRPRVLAKLSHLNLPTPCADVVQTLAGSPRTEFDRQPVVIRHRLLHLVDFLTADWPHTFTEFMNKASITSDEFATCQVEMPHWLNAVVKTDLNRKRYRITVEEISSAKALLRKHHAARSKIAIKRLLGVHEATALDRALPVRRRRLSDEELLRVLKMLDSDIADAPNGREVQASMLRDAACIAAAASLRIPLAKASALDFQAGEALNHSWSATMEASTADGQIAEISCRWMTLYLRGTRARFERFDRPQAALFLSRFGIPTKGSGLGARFASLLRRNGIDGWGRGSHLLSNESKVRLATSGANDAGQTACASPRSCGAQPQRTAGIPARLPSRSV